MKIAIRALALLLALVVAAPALTTSALAASAPAAGKPTPDKPAATSTRQTPIAILHEGSDTAGARLSTRLKERFNGSNLFQLNEKDAPKMRILLTTQSEFADRPNVGSVYSIIWTFSQSEGHLGYLLARDVGTLSPDDVDALADKIVERTDGIAVKYAYLFQ